MELLQVSLTVLVESKWQLVAEQRLAQLQPSL